MALANLNGIKLHYVELGKGPHPAVFIHGLGVDDLSSWFFTVANAAAEVTRVVLYDLRGHGKSDRPAAGYAVSDMTLDLAKLCSFLGMEVGGFHLVGYSYGGLIALVFAAQYPELVRSLFLIDACIPDSDFAAQMRQTLNLEGEERDRQIAHAFKTWVHREDQVPRSRLAERARSLVHETSLIADLDRGPVLGPQDYRKITCPVMAIYGAESDTRAQAETMCRDLPACTLDIVDGATHRLLWQQTDYLRTRLVDWLRKNEDGRRAASV